MKNELVWGSIISVAIFAFIFWSSAKQVEHIKKSMEDKVCLGKLVSANISAGGFMTPTISTVSTDEGVYAIKYAYSGKIGEEVCISKPLILGGRQ